MIETALTTIANNVEYFDYGPETDDQLEIFETVGNGLDGRELTPREKEVFRAALPGFRTYAESLDPDDFDTPQEEFLDVYRIAAEYLS